MSTDMLGMSFGALVIGIGVGVLGMDWRARWVRRRAERQLAQAADAFMRRVLASQPPCPCPKCTQLRSAAKEMSN